MATGGNFSSRRSFSASSHQVQQRSGHRRSSTRIDFSVKTSARYHLPTINPSKRGSARSRVRTSRSLIA